MMLRSDVLTLLKQDHVELKSLLEQLTQPGEPVPRHRAELLSRLRSELEMHTSIEEEIFYPAFRAASRTKQDEAMYFDAIEEHHAVHMVLADLLAADPSSTSFSGKAKVLKELILHHAREEESAMFPRARKLLSRELRHALAGQVEFRKLEFRATG
jgi:iron-sulfur cluster repair protein YtfE (RIC family)